MGCSSGLVDFCQRLLRWNNLAKTRMQPIKGRFQLSALLCVLGIPMLTSGEKARIIWRCNHTRNVLPQHGLWQMVRSMSW
jgi:hypothetical protein